MITTVINHITVTVHVHRLHAWAVICKLGVCSILLWKLLGMLS